MIKIKLCVKFCLSLSITKTFYIFECIKSTMRLRKILELNKEEEEKQTFTEIEEGVFFRGHNL